MEQERGCVGGIADTASDRITKESASKIIKHMIQRLTNGNMTLNRSREPRSEGSGI